MVSLNHPLIMNGHHTCILTDSKIQYTGCLHAAMEMSGTVTCETFNKGFNTHSGQTTSTRRTKGNSQPHNYGGRIWTLTF